MAGTDTATRLFDLLVAAGHPLPVADLATALGVHPNAVRHHLGRFVRQGVVDRSVDPRGGPGRPRQLYSARATHAEAPAATRPYQRLAFALLEARRSGRSLRAVGREAALQVELPAGDDQLRRLVEVLVADGFEPRVERDAAGEATVVLERCPFVEAAMAYPAAVCLTHRGLAEGLVTRLGDLRVARLEARDPQAGGCRLVLTTPEMTSEEEIAGSGRGED